MKANINLQSFINKLNKYKIFSIFLEKQNEIQYFKFNFFFFESIYNNIYIFFYIIFVICFKLK